MSEGGNLDAPNAQKTCIPQTFQAYRHQYHYIHEKVERLYRQAPHSPHCAKARSDISPEPLVISCTAVRIAYNITSLLYLRPSFKLLLSQILIQGRAWKATTSPQPTNNRYLQEGENPAASASVQDGPAIGPSPATAPPRPSLATTTPGLSPYTPSPHTTAAGPSQDGSPATAARKRPPRRRSRKCDFVDTDGNLCGRVMSHNFDRHWVAHGLTELEAVQRRGLPMQEAKIVKSPQCQKLLELHKLTCPLGCTDFRMNLLTFSRKDHLRRHLKRHCKRLHSQEEVSRLSNEAATVTGWSETAKELRQLGDSQHAEHSRSVEDD